MLQASEGFTLVDAPEAAPAQQRAHLDLLLVQRTQAPQPRVLQQVALHLRVGRRCARRRGRPLTLHSNNMGFTKHLSQIAQGPAWLVGATVSIGAPSLCAGAKQASLVALLCENAAVSSSAPAGA